jgi:hypothetical protein
MLCLFFPFLVVVLVVFDIFLFLIVHVFLFNSHSVYTHFFSINSLVKNKTGLGKSEKIVLYVLRGGFSTYNIRHPAMLRPVKTGECRSQKLNMDRIILPHPEY